VVPEALLASDGLGFVGDTGLRGEWSARLAHVRVRVRRDGQGLGEAYFVVATRDLAPLERRWL